MSFAIRTITQTFAVHKTAAWTASKLPIIGIVPPKDIDDLIVIGPLPIPPKAPWRPLPAPAPMPVLNPLWGDSGANLLYGSSANDTIYGGGGNDTIYGGAGADRLFGDEGDDLLIGDAGADTLRGGSGFDTVSYATASGAVRIQMMNNLGFGFEAEGDVILDVESIVGSRFNDTITGRFEADGMHGGDGNDYLFGDDGNDSLYGERGHDTLVGGLGSDHLFGGEGNDLIEEVGGRNIINGGEGLDTLSYRNAAVGISVDAGVGDIVTNVEVLEASRFNDRLFVVTGLTQVYGLDGDDTIGGDVAMIDGGAGADVIFIDHSRAGRFDGGAGYADTLSFANQAQGVTGLVFTNRPDGTHFSQTVGSWIGAGRQDYIDIERLVGSRHSDSFTVGGGMRRVEMGAGDDRLTAMPWSIAGGLIAVDPQFYDGGEGRDHLHLQINSMSHIDHWNDSFVIDLAAGTVTGRGWHVQNLVLANFANFETFYVEGLWGKNSIVRGTAGGDYFGGDFSQLYGGAGNDTLTHGHAVYNDATSGLVVDHGVGAVIGSARLGSEIDQLISIRGITGTAHSDRIVGGAETRTIIGGAGNDRIKIQAAGSALLDGGMGDDLLMGRAGHEFIGGAIAEWSRYLGGLDRFVIDQAFAQTGSVTLVRQFSSEDVIILENAGNFRREDIAVSRQTDFYGNQTVTLSHAGASIVITGAVEEFNLSTNLQVLAGAFTDW